jgi:hypothetical protein
MIAQSLKRRVMANPKNLKSLGHNIRLKPDEPTLQDVSEDIGRVSFQLNEGLTELGHVKETLAELASSIDDLQKSVDKMD